MPASVSLAKSIASRPREVWVRAIEELSEQDATKLLYDWGFWARPDQLAPAGDWLIWLILTGRGWGKSRTGAEFVRDNVERGNMSRIALVARTAADVRDVMIEGESGILEISPPWFRPAWEPSKRRLTWPNGAIATTFSADEPDVLRGPQHDGGWCDEVASWRYPDAWDMLMFGMRLGSPRVCVTTTPRPTKLIKQLAAANTTHMTRGSTYDNLDNLAPAFRQQILERYEGTRIGRQEIDGEIVDDVEGALWQRPWIDDHRVTIAPGLTRVVVAIDPAVTHGEDADETGIAVCGLGDDGDFYVLNVKGYRLSPDGWANRAVKLYDDHAADKIIAERNNGGEMVEATIRSVRRNLPVKTIVASRGKTVRAEPVAALYEQGRVHHVGVFPEAEDQMCAFPVANDHDDLVDAVVYGLTELDAPRRAAWGAA